MKVKKADSFDDICIRNCLLNRDCAVCIGCGRTLDEISAWPMLTPVEKQRVIDRINRG